MAADVMTGWAQIWNHPLEKCSMIFKEIASNPALQCYTSTSQVGLAASPTPSCMGSSRTHRGLLSSNTARSLSENLSIRAVEFWRKPGGTLDAASPRLSLPPQLSPCPRHPSQLFLSVSLSLLQTFRDARSRLLLPL